MDVSSGNERDLRRRKRIGEIAPRVGTGTPRDRSAQIRTQIDFADVMLADRVVPCVKRRYRTTDAQQPMVEVRSDGFRPAPHDLVHAHVVVISSGHAKAPPPSERENARRRWPASLRRGNQRSVFSQAGW